MPPKTQEIEERPLPNAPTRQRWTWRDAERSGDPPLLVLRVPLEDLAGPVAGAPARPARGPRGSGRGSARSPEDDDVLGRRRARRRREARDRGREGPGLVAQ